MDTHKHSYMHGLTRIHPHKHTSAEAHINTHMQGRKTHTHSLEQNTHIRTLIHIPRACKKHTHTLFPLRPTPPHTHAHPCMNAHPHTLAVVWSLPPDPPWCPCPRVTASSSWVEHIKWSQTFPTVSHGWAPELNVPAGKHGCSVFLYPIWGPGALQWTSPTHTHPPSALPPCCSPSA